MGSLRLECYSSLSPLFAVILPYSCHVCGFETELNVQFVSHMSLHVDKEQWMFSICCTACDFVTMEEAEIKAHIGTKHTGDHSCRSFSPFSPSPSAPPPRPRVLAHLAEASSSPCDTNIPFLRRKDFPRRAEPSFPVATFPLCLADPKDSQVETVERCRAVCLSIVIIIGGSR